MLRIANVCPNNYQTTQAANEPVNEFFCKFSRKIHKYKSKMCQLQEEGSMVLNASIIDKFPSIEDVLNSTLYKFITP